MFIGNGARSGSIRSHLAALTLLALETAAHAQSAIPEHRLPDLCSGAYYNRAAYIVRFDVQTNTFSRPATDPLESEEIVLCMDGTPDPLVAYSIEYADQTAGSTPTAQSVAVGSAPTAFSDPRLSAQRSSATYKCDECRALAFVQGLMHAELAQLTRALTSTGNDGNGRTTLRQVAEHGPCGCAASDTCPSSRQEYCGSVGPWSIEGWLNSELDRGNVGLRLIDGSWIASTPRPDAPPPSRAGGTEATDEQLRSDGIAFGPDGASAPTTIGLGQLPVGQHAVSFEVAQGSDSVLVLFGRAPNGAWGFVDENDDISAQDLGSRIVFTAQAGWDYRLELYSYWPERALVGRLKLSGADGGQTTPPRAEPEETNNGPAIEYLKQAIHAQLATYERLRALATNLHTTHAHHRLVYRVGSYAGNRLLLLRVREHHSTLRLSEDGGSLVHAVENASHSISLTIRGTSWFSLNAGMVVSRLPTHTFHARQASETQTVLMRDIADWSVDPVFFATIHWCAQDLSRPVYARRCAGYAPTPRNVVNPADVPLGTGPFNHLSPEAEGMRRVERLRRWMPGFAIGVPLDRKVFDFNLMLGLSLPYIPYVSIITGVQLARVTRVREGIGLAPASGSAGDATTFGVGQNAVDAGTHERLVPGWFIAITLTDEIFRALFPSLEAASK